MKKLQTLITRRNIKAPAISALVMAILLGAWFSTASADDPNACTVCHKGTQTLTFACNSLDYRRHKDHGDPDGACGATPPTP